MILTPNDVALYGFIIFAFLYICGLHKIRCSAILEIILVNFTYFHFTEN